MIECAREAEVLDAVTFRRWPRHCDEGCDEGLRTHVAACAICADLVEVARALHDDRESACRDARVPAAGQVWWRATIRARADAAHTAAEPITVLQGIAGACLVGAAAGRIGLKSPAVINAMSALFRIESSCVTSSDTRMPSNSSTS